MIRPTLMIAAACSLAAPALAETTLSIPLGPDAQVTPYRYACDGGEPFPVQYINAEPYILALLPIDGQQRIFVNVISGSGARYVSGEYEWWSKGDEATLSNAMEDGPGKTCKSVEAE